MKIAGAIFRPNKLCQKLEFRDVMNVTFWASELFFPAPTPRKDRIKREGRSRHDERDNSGHDCGFRATSLHAKLCPQRFSLGRHVNTGI